MAGDDWQIAWLQKTHRRDTFGTPHGRYGMSPSSNARFCMVRGNIRASATIPLTSIIHARGVSFILLGRQKRGSN